MKKGARIDVAEYNQRQISSETLKGTVKEGFRGCLAQSGKKAKQSLYKTSLGSGTALMPGAKEPQSHIDALLPLFDPTDAFANNVRLSILQLEQLDRGTLLEWKANLHSFIRDS